MMIIVVLIIGLVLRVISLDQSLWLDEAISVLAIKQNSLWQLITQFTKYDLHPPIYYLFLSIWSKFFGFGEIALRVSSVIFGVVTIYLIYLIGKKLFNPQAALYAAILLCLSPLHIYYSQEVRMYVLSAAIVVANYLFFIKSLEKKRGAIWGYIISGTLLLYTDYINGFVFLAQIAYLGFFDRKQLNKFLLSLVGVTALFTPWLPILNKQYLNGQQLTQILPAWGEVVGSGQVKELLLTAVKFIIGRITFTDKIIYLIAVSVPGFLLTYSLWSGWRSSTSADKKKGLLLIFWLIIPITISWIISWHTPIFSYFRLLYCLPALYLLLGWFWQKASFKYYLVIVTFILLELVFTGVYLFNPKYQREDWRGVVQFLSADQDNESPILIESNGLFAPLTYYGSETSTSERFIPALSKIPVNQKSDLVLTEMFSTHSHIFYIQYLVDITDPKRLLQKQIEELGFKVKQIKDFNGVGFVYRYEK